MDTACLRIKFTPLMKKVRTDDSKCYLEIVPEVSCLKNFDKIEWKHENNFYEYVIPMTYKIIVKRRECHEKDVDDGIDSLNQMYHSCVDLLHPSVTDSVLAAGDLNRILSDNFILSRVTTDIDRCDIILSQHNEIFCMRHIKDTKATTSMQTVEESGDFTLATYNSTILVKHINEQIVNNTENQMKSCHTIIDTFKQSVEKGTRTSQETISPITIAKDKSSDGTIQYNLPERNPVESMRKLSLSPICSVNTDCMFTTSLYSNSNNANIVIPHDYLVNKDILPYGNLSSIEEKVFNVFSTSHKPKPSLYFEASKRITPEKRIEQFLTLIQKEILPLKSMLDDIHLRYMALNTGRNYKTTLINKKQQKNDTRETQGSQKQFKSNRVVYTIVFDG